MSLTRRQFIWTTAASTVGLASAKRPEAGWPLVLHAQAPDSGPSGRFRHGVASGDPLTDRVVLWTRVTAGDGLSPAAVDVEWRIAADPAVERTSARGTFRTTAERDFTVKIDAGGLEPGRAYYYVFEAGGERSAIGRTKTLPAGDTTRVRLASLCCSNYPSGFFNVYRCVANRLDLDAVVHVGDYIYEFENGRYGDGAGLLRIPEPRREAVTLSDYRIRYATYRLDPDLQEAHRQHPFIAVWDDHEVTNDAWSGGASNHNPEQGEGGWAVRQAAAYRAYLEWMPVRETPGPGIHLYRSFRFGSLMDLIMLDTRGLRDRQARTEDLQGLADPTRTILGTAQEAWLFDELRSSQRAGTAWRLLGQQVLFSRVAPPDWPVLSPDTWDGYQAARDRVLDCLATERVRDVAILSGDLHSSWALDVARDPWRQYQPSTGEGSLAVELLAPAISSPPLFANASMRDRAPLLRTFLPHLKFLDGDSRGYVLIDITPQRLQAEWYFVPTVLEHTAAETRAAGFVCERGSSRLINA
ncbi:MAG: alkaline phosphatase D family protein [Vicinamibacterales bacterium]